MKRPSCKALTVVVGNHKWSDHLGNLYEGNVTFRGLFIVNYSYDESQRDALFLKFI